MLKRLIHLFSKIIYNAIPLVKHVRGCGWTTAPDGCCAENNDLFEYA